MGFRGTQKRRSKFGPSPKPDAEKASEFVGVKMKPATLRALDRLVAWAGGRRARASHSSVIVNLIEDAFRRGDPRKGTSTPPSQPTQPLTPEEREEAMERARKKLANSTDGSKVELEALAEIEELRGTPITVATRNAKT